MWYMGMYVQNAVGVAVEHCLAGRKAKSKYMQKPIMHEEEFETKDSAEKNEILAAMEMEQWANSLRRKGLKETII